MSNSLDQIDGLPIMSKGQGRMLIKSRANMLRYLSSHSTIPIILRREYFHSHIIGEQTETQGVNPLVHIDYACWAAERLHSQATYHGIVFFLSHLPGLNTRPCGCSPQGPHSPRENRFTNNWHSLTTEWSECCNRGLNTTMQGRSD